jgi:hypothetical protein
LGAVLVKELTELAEHFPELGDVLFNKPSRLFGARFVTVARVISDRSRRRPSRMNRTFSTLTPSFSASLTATSAFSL